MNGDPDLYRVRDSSLFFTDEEIKLMKMCIFDLYKIFKKVFDRPRLLQKPFNSLTHYKIKMQRKYESPEEFYTFTSENVNIHIKKRRGNIYSVAVSGIALDEKVLHDFELVDKNPAPYEVEFSCGFAFYGKFARSDFSECVNLFYKLVLQVLAMRFGIDYKPIIKQFEFIF